MPEARITSELLSWALSRSRLSPSHVAEKAHVGVEKLLSWESGEAWPTFRQAQNLAHVLHVPFGYLFLSKLPEERLALPDLRTFAEAPPERVSVDLRDVINDALRKQEWYREYAVEEGEPPADFVGSYGLHDAPERVAEDIVRTLSIHDDLLPNAVSWTDYLSRLSQKAEEIGILVLRSGFVETNTHRTLSVEEFRGFAIGDEFAPLVFINTRDAKAAQIFTFAHELAHLWIGQSGISSPDMETPIWPHERSVERFCSRVAAEVLVPQSVFIAGWNPRTSVEEELQTQASRYRVSTVMILRRARELGRIPREGYYRFLEREKDRQQESRESGSGGNFYALCRVRHSPRLTYAVVSAALEGRILFRDAVRLLGGVKVKTILGLGKWLELSSL